MSSATERAISPATAFAAPAIAPTPLTGSRPDARRAPPELPAALLGIPAAVMPPVASEPPTPPDRPTGAPAAVPFEVNAAGATEDPGRAPGSRASSSACRCSDGTLGTVTRRRIGLLPSALDGRTSEARRTGPAPEAPEAPEPRPPPDMVAAPPRAAVPFDSPLNAPPAEARPPLRPVIVTLLAILPSRPPPPSAVIEPREPIAGASDHEGAPPPNEPPDAEAPAPLAAAGTRSARAATEDGTPASLARGSASDAAAPVVRIAPATDCPATD